MKKDKKLINIAEEIQRINQTNFLHFQYTNRKFFLDLENGAINNEKWRVCYWDMVKCIVEEFFEDMIFINGMFIDKNEAIEHHIRGIHCLYFDDIAFLFNSIVAYYNNSLVDNPEFVYRLCYDVDENVLHKIISINKRSLNFILDLCLKYGYFPSDLYGTRNALNDYQIVDKDVNLVESFIKKYNKNDIVRTHFVSDNQNCYFEKDDGKSFYIYYNTNKEHNLDSLLTLIKSRISRKGKKNFDRHLMIDEYPNMQICINMNNKFDINDILVEIKKSLIVAIAYSHPIQYIVSKELTNVACDIAETKHKKTSYLSRFIGLFIWDNVHVANRKLSDVINALISVTVPNGLDENWQVAPYQAELEEWRKLLRSGKEEGYVLEYNTLDREYRLACTCIETLSIRVHGSSK